MGKMEGLKRGMWRFYSGDMEVYTGDMEVHTGGHINGLFAQLHTKCVNLRTFVLKCAQG